jgi:hypothetical protein
MPVIDQNNFAQFAQASTQQTARVADFALAVRKLAVAEEQFKVRQKFQEDQFAFKEKTWAAERGMRDAQLRTLETKLGAFEEQQARQEGARKALPAAFQGLARVRAAELSDPGTAEEVAEEYVELLGSPEIAPHLPEILPILQGAQGTLGTTSAFINARLKARGVTPPTPLKQLELENEVRLEAQRRVTTGGRTLAEVEDAFNQELTQMNKQIQGVASELRPIFSQMRLQAEGQVMGAAFTNYLEQQAGNPTVAGLSRGKKQLDQLRDKTTTPQDRQIVENALKRFRALTVQAEEAQMRMDAERSRVFVATDIANTLLGAGKPLESDQARRAFLGSVEAQVGAVGSIVRQLEKKEAYNDFLKADTPETAQANHLSLMNLFQGQLAQPDPVLSSAVSDSLWRTRDARKSRLRAEQKVSQLEQLFSRKQPDPDRTEPPPRPGFQIGSGR